MNKTLGEKRKHEAQELIPVTVFCFVLYGRDHSVCHR